MPTLKYEGKFENGIKYQIHTASSFSGREELALFVADEMIAVWSIDIKKAGTIECKPVTNATKMIRPEGSKVDAIKDNAESADTGSAQPIKI